MEEEAVKIVDQFYDLQFDRALESAQELDKRYPGSPAGPFYLSVIYYQRYLLEDPPSPSTFQRFQIQSERALENALRMMPTHPILGHYYQGAALGFQARAAVAQKKYRVAIPKAKAGAQHLQKALEMDPSLIDAKLGLGLYYYFLARVPTAAKPFAYLMVGMWGDRDKGLSYLQEVAQHGQAARQEARSVLGSIYASPKEQEWEAAAALLLPLVAQYPHNPSYRMKLLYVFERQGKWADVIAKADLEGSWIETLHPSIKNHALTMARYRTVEGLLFSGHVPEADILLGQLEHTAQASRLQDWILLRRGNARDAEGKPADAQRYYERIRSKKVASLASRFQKSPFPGGPRDVMPARWPVPSVPAD